MKDDLIARLEAATEPCRELDAEIAVAKGWNRREGTDWFTPPNLTVNHHISELPRYTASIDAALTLAVNSGFAGLLLQIAMQTIAERFACECLPTEEYRTALARAFCIAALRAMP